MKLKKRNERSRKSESLAYHGRKYRTPEYAPILHQTEIGIYECYVLFRRELTDDEVETALGTLIELLRLGADPAVPPADRIIVTGENQEELVIESIRNRWHRLAEPGELTGRDELIGILRTILSSLETWRSQSLHAQGYLRFLEGFLKETGVNVRMERREPSALDGLPD